MRGDHCKQSVHQSRAERRLGERTASAGPEARKARSADVSRMNIHEPAAARTPCRSRESRLAQANIGDMPDVQAGAVTLPSVVAHADWSVERG